ncbi:unnamed protein product [Adineta ricciae]|uniref:Uncharacterized protein n=1 Tax=Adineta ricciae TaxID=249248 RepID=A0A816C2N5_ADIRI|nr:unnamed protein product [Adineta ricciae]CAF1619233.1 unnamed protein product [Adineta ricciae]
MFQHIREALIEKIDEQREHALYCTVQWFDTRKIEVIPKESIQLAPSRDVEVNITYTIVIDGIERYGTVLATGTKEQCEMVKYKRSPDISAKKLPGNLVDDLMLMRILSKLMNKPQTDEISTGEDIHQTECASCKMKPIRHLDRYHCLECPSSVNYDLCGRCFEKRRETGSHSSGHAMIHFKLPNEFLGIHVNDVKSEVTLSNLKRMSTLRNEVHKGITCNGVCAQRTLTGLRFKCDTCANYNLCETCAIQKHICTKSHEKTHPLILTSNNVMPKIDPDEIEFGEVLGRGGFGYVCKALWRPKNRQVACKIIEVSGSSSTSQSLQRSFLLELAAYRELSGPYILRTYGYATRELPSNRIRGSTTQFMILMELMGRGSFQTLLDNEPNKLSLRRKLAMCRQVASGMRRIHQHGMIHRDIRPDNILVTDDYVAKIGDMGIARVLDPEGRQTQLGCLQFMPPEFFRDAADGRAKCNEKLDIYTYGLTLNQIFTETMHDFRLNRTPSRLILTKQSPIFYDEIISKCLEDDPKRRPTAIEIEKTLEFYEQAFAETMLSESYVQMNTKEKDRAFLDFYQKNKGRLHRFIKEQFPQQFIREVPIEFINKQKQSPADDHD